MKNILAIPALCAVFILGTASSIQAQIYTPDFERFTLSNGLSVILHKDTTTASVSVNMAYHAGSSRDPKGKHGLANICGSIAVLGSKNVTYRDMLRLQYFADAKITGSTNVDLMSVSSTFPAEYLEAALWVEADRMNAGDELVTERVLASVAGNLIAQRRKAATNPLSNVDDKIYAELYPEGHPYKHTSIGDTTEIKSIRIRDVRDFMKRYYVPANASLTIAGNFNFEQARGFVKKYFSGIAAGEAAAWRNLPPLAPLGKASIVKEDVVSSSRLYIIIPTVSRSHPDAPALDLIAKFLAGTVNAVLQQRMVDKNPYVVYLEASQSSRELDGNFWIVINCRYEAQMKDIYAQVKREIEGLAKTTLTSQELNEAKSYSRMLYNMVMEEPLGMGGRAESMNRDQLLEDSPLFTTDAISSQMRISWTELQSVITRYFNFENIFTLSIVPNGAGARGVVFE